MMDEKEKRDRQGAPVVEVIPVGIKVEARRSLRLDVACTRLDLGADDLAGWELAQRDLDRAVDADVLFEKVAPDQIEPVAGYKALGKLRRLDRMIRYRSIPKGGWGQGWRSLIFRYRKNNRRQLLVLAPVDGDQFDYVLWNSHVRQND